jgi:hypothetical protein
VLVFYFAVPRHLHGHATARAISRRLPAAAVQFDHRLVHEGFVVGKLALSNAVSLGNSHCKTAPHSLIILSQTLYRLDTESVVWRANLKTHSFCCSIYCPRYQVRSYHCRRTGIIHSKKWEREKIEWPMVVFWCSYRVLFKFDLDNSGPSLYLQYKWFKSFVQCDQYMNLYLPSYILYMFRSK